MSVFKQDDILFSNACVKKMAFEDLNSFITCLNNDLKEAKTNH